MRTKRFLGLLLLLFFVFMAGVTVYSIWQAQRSLPMAEIAVAQKEDDNRYRVPLSALCKDEYNQPCVLLVTQQQGAWQTEYVCVRYPVSFIQTQGEFADVSCEKLAYYPIVIKSNQPVNDQSRVRLS